jgi:hypothetical protein
MGFGVGTVRSAVSMEVIFMVPPMLQRREARVGFGRRMEKPTGCHSGIDAKFRRAPRSRVSMRCIKDA